MLDMRTTTTLTQPDVQHRIWSILLEDRLLATPHSNIATLVDLGCGSAIWTAAVARELPETQVIGVDLTPPENNFGLANLTFAKADIEQPWSFAPSPADAYDLMSLRVLVSAVQDWPSLLQQCFRYLKPGAWIEIPDIVIGTFSDTFSWQDESSPLMRWYQCYRKGALANGIDGFAGQRREEDLSSAGFVCVSQRSFRCYQNEEAVDDSKGKTIAKLMRENVFGLLDAVTSTMQKRGQWDLLGLTSVELQQLTEDAREDIVQNSAHRRYHWIL